MVLAMAGAFMTLSTEQSNGEPVAAISHEIEVAGSGGGGTGCYIVCDDATYGCPPGGCVIASDGQSIRCLGNGKIHFC